MSESVVLDDPTLRPTEEDLERYDLRLEEVRDTELHIPVQRVDGRPVVWAPQRGSQTDFMACPLFECLYHGTRGPGKTDALLMDFAQHVGRGYGSAWRGVLFRRTYPELADVQAKSEKWFPRIFPGAKFNRARMTWEWPTGEALLLRHMMREADYNAYHGHEYPWIGWEELTNWANSVCYKKMFSCCRTSTPGVPKKVRATTNPYGVGHGWVKDRFRLHGKWWQTIIITDAKDEDGNKEPDRCAIHGHIDENQILLAADPNYKTNITAAASNPGMKKAWLYGAWDIPAGGMFDDVWSPKHNVVADFVVPPSWIIDRAFDWGSSRPFSVGWFAESDGGDLLLKDGRVMATVRGDLFRIREWYGCTGQPNQGLRMLARDVARGIVERESAWGWMHGQKTIVQVGPADSHIYTVEDGPSVAQNMEDPVRIGRTSYPGIRWFRADKSPGSRPVGWELMRTMIRNARPERGMPREEPGFFVVGEHCPHFLRTVLALPRDEIKVDDVDTDSEDHIGDECRYRVRACGTRPTSGTTTGYY